MNATARDRRAVRRLRRGIVPGTHIDSLTVGAEGLLRDLNRLLDSLKGGTAEVGFVHGEWGMGKTHTLRLIHHLCLRDGYSVAYTNLNGRSAALNHPQRFYHLVASRIRLQDNPAGLPFLIDVCVRDTVRRDKLEHWAATNRTDSEFAAALYRLLSMWRVPSDAPAHAWSILVGTDLAWADYAYKREKALLRLADLGECMAAVGAGGLVLELDELETIDQLWNVRSRVGAYGVLGRLFEMRRVLPIFAVTDRFHRLVEFDLEYKVAPEDVSLSIAARAFLVAWRNRSLRMLSPPIFSESLAHGLVGKIAALYRAAFGHTALSVRPAAIVEQWVKSPRRSPRSLIRRTIHEMDVARNGFRPA